MCDVCRIVQSGSPVWQAKGNPMSFNVRGVISFGSWECPVDDPECEQPSNVGLIRAYAAQVCQNHILVLVAGGTTKAHSVL
jgi:hypothetical protein